MVLLMAMCALSVVSVREPSLARAEGAAKWLCKAEAVYSTCSPTRAWRVCREHRLEGLGLGADKTSACMEAEQACSDNLIRTMIVENRQGIASIKSRCAMTTCELDSIAKPTSRMLSKGL
jgi:hypothetical protein